MRQIRLHKCMYVRVCARMRVRNNDMCMFVRTNVHEKAFGMSIFGTVHGILILIEIDMRKSAI